LTSGYCAVATLGAESRGGTVIKDTIIFAHSMGNLVFATALKQGVCSLDSSSSWYALSPPIYGTKAATKIQYLCQAPQQVNPLLTLLAIDRSFCSSDSPLVQYGNEYGLTSFSVPSVKSIGLASAQLLASAPNLVHHLTMAWNETAPATNTWLNADDVLDPSTDVEADAPIYVNPGWVCMVPDDPALVGLDQIVNSNIKGGICGTDPFGLISEHSLALLAISAYVRFGEPNDGHVGLSSCQGLSAPSAWDDNPHSNFYLHKYNHVDTTGRHGGPLKAWFASRQ